MPFISHNNHQAYYEISGPSEGPVFIMVNGLTQYSSLWKPYVTALAQAGFRVATFDLLGQGVSDKPAFFISQDDQVAIIHELVETLGQGEVYLAGISFGGVIALRYAIAHPDKLTGLVAMSTFAELSPQLLLLGTALRNGLVLGGISYLQDLLLPMNLSNEWLGAQMDNLEAIKRPGWLANDVYALQNLMESFMDFKPLTPDLPRITVPTLILNGEFDFLTPRALHETLRLGIPDSALVIIPHAYHAFTLEKPTLTASLMSRFAERVRNGLFTGGRSIWIASETDEGELLPFPAGFDHLRAVPAPPESLT
ncbi:MAG: alpha/beta fold hydrolase [Xanthobacter sp.]